MSEDQKENQKIQDKEVEKVQPLPPLIDLPQDKLETLAEGYGGNDFLDENDCEPLEK